MKKDTKLSETTFYEYGDSLIEAKPEYVYEICSHKYWKGGYNIEGNKFYSSSKPLKIKKDYIDLKLDDCLIRKEIKLVGAPIEFIEKMHLKIYKPKK